LPYVTSLADPSHTNTAVVCCTWFGNFAAALYRVDDQFGREPDVTVDVYTISDLEQRIESIDLLEQGLASTAVN